MRSYIRPAFHVNRRLLQVVRRNRGCHSDHLDEVVCLGKTHGLLRSWEICRGWPQLIA